LSGDATLPDQPSSWRELDVVLREHCDRVGRSQSEIVRSVHLKFAPYADGARLADQAAEFVAVGVDIVVWSMRGFVDASRLEPLASPPLPVASGLGKVVKGLGVCDEDPLAEFFVGSERRNEIDKITVVWHVANVRVRPISAPQDAVGSGCN